MGDFMPNGLPVSEGVYVMRSRVVPKSDGTFLVAVANTSNVEITLKRQRRIGKLVPCGETIAEVEHGNHTYAEHGDKIGFSHGDEGNLDWETVKFGNVPNGEKHNYCR